MGAFQSQSGSGVMTAVMPKGVEHLTAPVNGTIPTV